MNLTDLEVFKAVVEEGGIIKAARRLHRVPSNVTMRIKQLEASLRVPLFHRNRQRLHLSPAGQLLIGYADRLIRLSEETRVVVAGTTPQGAFRLGALESTTASRLPPILANYHDRYPEVRLELSTATNDALVNGVIERRFDAALVVEPPRSGAIASEPVFAERLVVISNARHPAIRRPRDARGVSVIAFPDGCAYRRALQRWLGRESLAAGRILELNSYHAIVACVASGTGIALVPESVLDAMPNAQVRRHSIPGSRSRMTTSLIWRSDEVSPPVAALRSLLLETRRLGRHRP